MHRPWFESSLGSQLYLICDEEGVRPVLVIIVARLGGDV
jgi:hypothetical protein